jgi:hypothetical protein
MARTTAAEVKMINGSTLSDEIVNAYITSANIFVTNSLGTTLDEDVLTQIEMWLTAHMIAVTRERIAKKEGAGGAEIEYAGSFGENLKSTGYGQMACTLDTTGVLAGLGDKSKQVSFYAVETEY